MIMYHQHTINGYFALLFYKIKSANIMAQYNMFKENGKVGYKDSEGNIVIEPQYDCVVIEEGTALLCKDGLWGAKGLTQKTGLFASFFSDTTDIPIAYLEIKKLNSFYYGVKKQEWVEDRMVERFTIVDINGEEINVMKWEFKDVQFDNNFTFYNRDKILASYGGKFGFISLNGFVSIPNEYDAVVERSDGRFDVRIDDKWGIIDVEGRQVVAIKYDSPISLEYPNTIVKDATCGRLGVLSSDGIEKIPCIYNAIIITIPRDVPYEESKYYEETTQKYEGLAQYIGTDDEERYIYVGYKAYKGDGDYPTLLSSDIVCRNWGCYDNMGKVVVPPYYSDIKLNRGYILAEKEESLLCPGSRIHGYWRCLLYSSKGDIVLQGGKWDERSSTDKYFVDYEILDDYIVAKEVEVYSDESTYTQSSYLYNKSGELLIGGFNDFILEDGLLLLHFGGYWKTVHHVENYDSCGNYIGLEWRDDVFKEANGRWLIVDRDLKSVIRKLDGSEYCFKKGAVCRITQKNENGKKANYWNFPLDLFSLIKPVVSKGMAIIEHDSKKIAIRIEDGKYSQEYDEIKAIDKDTFFVKVKNDEKQLFYIGLCSFEKTIIGGEEQFVFLTIPNQGIVFGVISDKAPSDNDIVKLLCINTNETSPTKYTAINSIKFKHLVWAMERGELEFIVCPDISDDKQLFVRKIDLFETEFLDCFPYRIVQIEKEYKNNIYWYSDVYELKYSCKEKEERRIDDYRLNRE